MQAADRADEENRSAASSRLGNGTPECGRDYVRLQTQHSTRCADSPSVNLTGAARRFDELPCGKDLGQNVCGHPSGPHKDCLAFSLMLLVRQSQLMIS